MSLSILQLRNSLLSACSKTFNHFRKFLEERKWIKLKMNWWMVAWMILSIVSNVKANFSSWRENLKMHLKLQKMAKRLTKNIFKNLLTIVSFVPIVRQNNVRLAKIRPITLVRHVNSTRSWKPKSIILIN